MTQLRNQLTIRRAGLAATVLLGCSLLTISEIPGLAVGSVHPSDDASHAGQFVATQLTGPVRNGLDNPLSLHGQEPAASATKVSGAQPGTLPGLTRTGDAGAATSNTRFPTVTGPLSSASVPNVLAQAYQNAATNAPAGCHIPATLLAAIGQVESGNLQGQKITADHRAYPGIWGPELNGNGFEAIPDTDHGVLDGDTTWDRAVGPMQFIPSTWTMFAVDGDHDGKTDPQDVFDAASTAANYLCYGGRDLSTPAGVNAAVLSYNHSTDYLALVLKWKQSFDTGTAFSQIQTVPNLPNTPPAITPARPVTHTQTTTPGDVAGLRPVTTLPVPTTAPTTTAPTTVPSSTKPTTPVSTKPTAPSPTAPTTTPTAPGSAKPAPKTPTTPTPTTTPTPSAPASPVPSPTVIDAPTNIAASATGRVLTLTAPTTAAKGFEWTFADKDGKPVDVPSSTTHRTLVQSFAIGTYTVTLDYVDQKGATIESTVYVTLDGKKATFAKPGSTQVTPVATPSASPTASVRASAPASAPASAKASTSAKASASNSPTASAKPSTSASTMPKPDAPSASSTPTR